MEAKDNLKDIEGLQGRRAAALGLTLLRADIAQQHVLELMVLLERQAGEGGDIFQELAARTTIGLYDLQRGYDEALTAIESWPRQGIHICAITDSGYPESLRAIHAPPPLLFFKGRAPADLNLPAAIAIVGSRRADFSGCRIAHELSRGLAAAGVCVVSGLALGIDSAAHRGALECREYSSPPTIAVLGHGLDMIYPSANACLADQILEAEGYLLSIFEPGNKPLPINFLNRNRIISGLAQAVLVVQATAKSGSLVTARYGLEQNRDVLVVPGSIDDQRYAGSNALIKQGAHLVTSLEDIFEILPQIKRPEVCADLPDSPPRDGEHAVVQFLRKNGASNIDSISRTLSMELSQLSAEILQLELDGTVVRLPGNALSLA